MRLKAIVEASSRDGIMKTKPVYSLISLGKKAPTKNSPNEHPKVRTRVKNIALLIHRMNSVNSSSYFLPQMSNSPLRLTSNFDFQI